MRKYPYLRFPQFRNKAVTLSYDDGCIDDRRLVKILNEYDLKCTFNIPSSWLGTVGGHERIKAEEVQALYLANGHEIALHGKKHLKLTDVDIDTARADIVEDKNFWGEFLARKTFGMAYAFSAFNDEIVEMLKDVGIVYARGGKETKGFEIPTDWLRMPVTCHHNTKDMDALIDKFLAPFSQKDEARLFYMYGHSYEFGDDNSWSIMENFAKRLGKREDIWYATNMEIYQYVQAYNHLCFVGEKIRNLSDVDIYVHYGMDLMIPSRSEITLKKERI